MLAVGVCDPAGHLLGAITVGRRARPRAADGWRQRRRVAAPSGAPGGGGAAGGRSDDPPRRPVDAAQPRRLGVTTTRRRSGGSASRSRARSAPHGSSSSRPGSSRCGSGINITVAVLRWDPYPFILLNLAFSDAGGIRRTADPARAEPSGAARPRADRTTTAGVAPKRTQADTSSSLARSRAFGLLARGRRGRTTEVGDHLERLTDAVERIERAPARPRGAAPSRDRPPTRLDADANRSTRERRLGAPPALATVRSVLVERDRRGAAREVIDERQRRLR
jgi:hypothetical protein